MAWTIPSKLNTWTVPNVPCGVEMQDRYNKLRNEFEVPNVPCGVEISLTTSLYLSDFNTFLMYRVELKLYLIVKQVLWFERFLMYRVELKFYKNGTKIDISFVCS